MSDWTPDIEELLLSNSVVAARIEESTTKIWAEFLKGYFDGETHLGITYPKAVGVFFGQAKPQQELNGMCLHIIGVLDQAHNIRRFGDGKYTIWDGLKWEVFVKAAFQGANADGLTADGASQRASDALYGLLSRFNALRPINRAGIYMIRPTPPKLVPSTAYYVRRILITGKARAAI